MMDATRSERARLAVRVALAALALSAIALVGGARPDVSRGDDPVGLKFDVRCSRDHGKVVSCTLVVTGLPDPLDDQVSVTLLTTTDVGSASDQSVPVSTVVASEAPDVTPGAPALVTRHLPHTPPSPPPRSPKVPEQPPKSL